MNLTERLQPTCCISTGNNGKSLVKVQGFWAFRSFGMHTIYPHKEKFGIREADPKQKLEVFNNAHPWHDEQPNMASIPLP